MDTRDARRERARDRRSFTCITEIRDEAVVTRTVHANTGTQRAGEWIVCATAGEPAAELLRFGGRLRQDRSDREALLRERKHLCGSVAFHIFAAQSDFFASAYMPPLAEQRAALRALGNEVLVTWRMCVREESECGSMSPGLPLNPTEDVLGVIRRCFEGGPPPLESARLYLKD